MSKASVSGKTATNSGGSLVADGKCVAILFHRFGPYHIARLKSAAEGMSLAAIEYSNVDSTYKWNLVAGEYNFSRCVLFPDIAAESQSASKILATVHRMLDQLRPAVVAIPGWSDRCALAALDWCARNQCAAIMMSDSTSWDELRKPWKEFFKRRILRLCAAGFAAGRNHVDYLAQLEMPRDQIFQGYDVVDNEYFSAKAREIRIQKSEIRNKLGLPEKYFLASARFVEKKNLLRLIQAYAQYRLLAGKNKNENHRLEAWSLVLLGDGPLKPEILRLISELHLENHVFLPGFKQYEELPAYFALAEVFIHASTTEQWGLVVNEAMASGLPVLVSNRCGCAADLVSDGVNGFTFDPFDVGKIAELMAKISAVNFPLSKFGLESQRIISSWGPERFAAGLQAAAKFAVEHPPKRAGWLDRLLLNILLRR
jgi:glycosyltransferase involved in cell wall biosynthesis